MGMSSKRFFLSVKQTPRFDSQRVFQRGELYGFVVGLIGQAASQKVQLLGKADDLAAPPTIFRRRGKADQEHI